LLILVVKAKKFSFVWLCPSLARPWYCMLPKTMNVASLVSVASTMCLGLTLCARNNLCGLEPLNDLSVPLAKWMFHVV
jgi:hypothetical protein